jgi:hypothetical protein
MLRIPITRDPVLTADALVRCIKRARKGQCLKTGGLARELTTES